MPQIACLPELRALAAGPVTDPPGSLPFAGLTALLVEDSRFASEGLRLMWRRGGGRFRRAETLALARRHWQTYRPDVVIVDLGLPDGRGEDLIREWAEGTGDQGWGRPALILGLSGDPDGRDTAMAAGARAFLEKPLPSFAQLQRLIERHLPRALAPAAGVGEEGSALGPLADGLGLRDDMLLAHKLLLQPVSEGTRRYIAGFLIGLARTAGDDDLRRLGEDFSAGRLSAATLAAALEARLAGGARL